MLFQVYQRTQIIQNPLKTNIFDDILGWIQTGNQYIRGCNPCNWFGCVFPTSRRDFQQNAFTKSRRQQPRQSFKCRSIIISGTFNDCLWFGCNYQTLADSEKGS